MSKLKNLTEKINRIQVAPTLLADVGLTTGDGKGIKTLHVDVEKKDGTLGLIPDQARGGPPAVLRPDETDSQSFKTAHLPVKTEVIADAVTGTDESIAEAIGDELIHHKQTHANTWEHMRLGALGGKVIDAKNNKVLADVWSAFGITQKSLAMNFSGADVNLLEKNNQALAMMRKAMKGQTINGAIAFCGESFFADLLKKALAAGYHLKETQILTISKNQYHGYNIDGIDYIPHTTEYGTAADIAASQAILVPKQRGFIKRWNAPATTMSQVNKKGVPIIVSQEKLAHDKGESIYSESNPLFLASVPEAIIKLKKGAS